MSALTEVRRKVREMASKRPGYRSIASAWDLSGRPIVRVDVDASVGKSAFSDLPGEMDGVRIEVHTVAGRVVAH